MTTASNIAFIEKLHQMVQDNFDYVSTASVSKARLFSDAIKGLLSLPEEMRNAAGEQQRYNTQTLLEMKRDADKFVSRQNMAMNQYVVGEYCND
jgi:hypothetical protein